MTTGPPAVTRERIRLRPQHVLALQVGVEEGDDPVPCVLGGGLVIADSCDAHHPEQKVAVVVEERVPGVGILLDVVLDSVCG